MAIQGRVPARLPYVDSAGGKPGVSRLGNSNFHIQLWLEGRRWIRGAQRRDGSRRGAM